MLKRSYWDVEQAVLRGAECAPEDLAALRSHIEACFMLVWAQCCDDRFYEEAVEVTLQEGDCQISLDNDAFKAPVYSLNHIRYRKCTMDATICSCKETCECVYLSTVDNFCKKEDGGPPECIELKKEVIYLDRPVEETTVFTVCYQREPVCDIIVPSTNPEQYAIPDIPPEFLAVLDDCVRSRWFMENEDWSNASPWNDVSRQSFAIIKEARNKPDLRSDSFTGAMVECMVKRDCAPCDEPDYKDFDVPPVEDYCVEETTAAQMRTQKWLTRSQTL